MATLLSVSEPTIAKWVDEGAPCTQRGGRGKAAQFDAPEFVKWWAGNKVSPTTAAKDGVSLSDRERMIDIATKELRYRQMEETVIEREAAVRVIRGVFATCAAGLRQSARRWAHLLIGVEDEAGAVEAQEKIAESIIADLRLPEMWETVHEDTEESLEGEVAQS